MVILIWSGRVSKLSEFGCERVGVQAGKRSDERNVCYDKVSLTLLTNVHVGHQGFLNKQSFPGNENPDIIRRSAILPEYSSPHVTRFDCNNPSARTVRP